MNPEQQRIAIAEACGWKSQPDKFYLDGLAWLNTNKPDIGGRCSTLDLPDYCNDLSAMHSAEEYRIEPHDIDEYAHQLYMVLERYWTVDRWMKFTRLGIDYAFAHAKANHKAEAFLRAIGKWTP